MSYLERKEWGGGRGGRRGEGGKVMICNLFAFFKTRGGEEKRSTKGT